MFNTVPINLKCRYSMWIVIDQRLTLLLMQNLFMKRKKKITQANPVSAVVDNFGYDDSWPHNQCCYKYADDCSCVRGRGCWNQKRQQEKLVKYKKGWSSRFIWIPEAESTPVVTSMLFTLLLNVYSLSHADIEKNAKTCKWSIL